jgi:aldose 1-epimerase
MTTMDRPFGTTHDGASARLLTLANDQLEAHLTDYGATLVGLLVPDRDGERADVVLGFDDVGPYSSPETPYLGATIGRVCNRVANGAFELGGVRYELARNEPPHHLHGGAERSFDKVVWEVDRLEPDAVTFFHVSPDGEEGYPGRVEASATYRLIDDALRIEYRAVTDAPTPLNMTNHAYYNLHGAGRGDILDHEIELMADGYTPVDDGLIPTGEIAEVVGTPLDLRVPTTIGDRIGDLAGTAAKGFDHNVVVRGAAGEPRLAARVHDPVSGRVLEVITDQPALQFYSGNGIGELAGKDGATYRAHAGLCLEPQVHPDAINQPSFPSVVVEPGQAYRHVTVLRFPGRVSEPSAAS